MPAELGKGEMEEAELCEGVGRAVEPSAPSAAKCRPALSAALLTGGQDPHYAVGLATALMNQNVTLDVIGNDELDVAAFHGSPRARFLNLHGSQASASRATRIGRIAAFYMRLLRYTLAAKPKVFHIFSGITTARISTERFHVFCRLLGKNSGSALLTMSMPEREDGTDSWLNRLTLRRQYGLAKHIFVHTKKMKDELVDDFAVRL